jgi:hypothetical protein
VKKLEGEKAADLPQKMNLLTSPAVVNIKFSNRHEECPTRAPLHEAGAVVHVRPASRHVRNRLQELDLILADSKRRQKATRFVVRCPEGHALGVVYVVGGELMFVSKSQFGHDRADVASTQPLAARAARSFTETGAATQFIDFLDLDDAAFPLPAQCECRFRLIPVEWLRGQLDAGIRGAVFDG